jgi:hypothetical protein
MDGLDTIVGKLIAARIVGDFWVNGSFLTQKIDPEDTDVVLHVDGLSMYELGTIGAGAKLQRVRLQTPEIVQLEIAIAKATENYQETMTGELVRIDYEDKTFQMRVEPDAKLISGAYENAVSLARPAQVPRRYFG